MLKATFQLFKKFLIALGAVCLIFIILSFTSLPYWAYYSLASVEDALETTPKNIVILGGDGMPSPSGLMRLYSGTEKAKHFSKANIILALPYNEVDSTHQLTLMREYMLLNGIDSNRIRFEPNGFSTRSQALEIDSMLNDLNAPILLVSSPEHMCRALATFRKVGFKNVGGFPTFENPSDESKLYDRNINKSHKINNLTLRYNIWSYMQYEIIVLREYAAIGYYWFKGWV